ncbi:MAG: pyridoxal phosphate-dependent aminotransferase [Bacteroidetes bacterium]|jgi:aspartate/methionine/tyrosine aminotransferase|nr:pyridoxal phosphate-dependent aminotransferase [Bacteroidota bacterium]
MQYRRMPIEIEAPETYGYENIDCNLSESSYADQRLGDLGISLNDLVLFYGDHLGKPALRELIASQYQLKADQILLTPGAAPALFMVASSLLEKGDHVIVAKSNYATNIETPRAIGANVSFLQMDFDKGYQLDIEALERLLTPATKFVSITYPHNPTGVSINESALKKVIQLVEANGSYLLMDETYREMSFIPMLPLAATLSDRVISVSSMSKSYGLPGIRMGWIICQNKKLMETFLAAKEQIFITNSVVDEEIAYQYMCNKEKLFAPVKATIKKNFEVLKHFMQNQEVLEWVEPQGGCACFPRIKKSIQIDTTQFHEVLLNKYSTYVGPGHWFEQDDRYMRIGYSWDKTEKLEKGMGNIVKAIQELRTA